MTQSECLTNIRNLEGVIDFDNCVYFSGNQFSFFKEFYAKIYQEAFLL